MRRCLSCLAVLASLFAVGAEPLASAATQDRAEPKAPVYYQAPVDAPIVDRFRPPAFDWSAGNRGVDYDAPRGTAVGAAGPGRVVFAGTVGGSQHVVVLHPDGVRTSYSFLASVGVRRGDSVEAGDKVGEAGGLLHFGARIGDAYVDPTILFDGDRTEVYLVPDTDLRALSEAGERAGLLRLLERAVSGALAAAAPRFDELEGLAHWVVSTYPVSITARGSEALREWWDQRNHCTPSGTVPPRPPPGGRRLLVLVAGLGSGSGNGAVFGVDTDALGYDRADVVRFSYRGGTVEQNPYGPSDTTVDIRESARRLRELLAETAAANPGATIDILAHSQGGLVARSALTDELDGVDPRLPPVSALVTLGTPHHGSDAATVAAMLGHSPNGRMFQPGAEPLLGFDSGSSSVEQLAETSEYLSRLNRRPLPEGVDVTSIAARGDMVVPARRARLDGARNVVVSVPGGVGDLASDHDRLPTSDGARREIALALAGMPPTCQGFLDAMANTLVSDGIALVEDHAGAAAWATARAPDPFLAR